MNPFSSSSESHSGQLSDAFWGIRVKVFPRLMKLLLILFAFYVFIVALQVMAGGFSLLGGHLAKGLVNLTANPFTSLFIGLLATAVVQSSSTTTTLIVSIVAAGGLTVPQAAPMIMGANVGTALTSTIVALGHIGDRREFQKAVSGASLHNIFNILTVMVLFWLEWSTHLLSGSAEFLATEMRLDHQPWLAQLLVFTRGSAAFLLEALAERPYLAVMAALITLFLSLRLLTWVMRDMIIGRLQQNLNHFLFGHPLRGLASGFFSTVALQSSSLTTSLMVPLVATEKVSLRQAFSFIMGANVGTTTTALIAAMVAPTAGVSAALAVAFTHVLFNLFGVLLLYPWSRLRDLPVWLADRLGKLAYDNRIYGVAYVVIVFFVLPFLLIFITKGLAWLS
jgi:solute carrier family 34 (sodium-dependent phosphate cotransporter)